MTHRQQGRHQQAHARRQAVAAPGEHREQEEEAARHPDHVEERVDHVRHHHVDAPDEGEVQGGRTACGDVGRVRGRQTGGQEGREVVREGQGDCGSPDVCSMTKEAIFILFTFCERKFANVLLSCPILRISIGR